MLLYAPRGLEPLSKLIPMPIEQFTFGFLYVVAIPVMACAQYECIRRHLISCWSRQLTSGLLGLIFLYALFGWDLLHLLLESGACYVTLVTCSPRIVHSVVMVIGMTYLSAYHIYRVYLFDEAQAVDISAPLMICTQKLTSLAFAVHDGEMRRERERALLQIAGDKSEASGVSSSPKTVNARARPSKTEKSETKSSRYVEQCPTFAEFFAYTFHFSAVICGPLIFIDDYLRWTRELEDDDNNPNLDPERASMLKERSKRLRYEVCWKAVVGVLYICMFQYITPHFPVARNVDLDFVARTPFIGRLAYACASMWASRFKYYLAWKLGELGQNIAGFGYDPITHKWDGISNVSIRGFEFATSMKSALDAWNKQTNVWLRYVCYDRIRNPRYAMLCTYLLSAVWHGFFPGYYFCFLSGALFTSAARSIRRFVRPSFQSSKAMQVVYGVLTWIGTTVSITYLVVPFMLLDLQRSLVFLHSSMRWSGHLVALLSVFLLPRLASAARGRHSTASTAQRSAD